MSETFILEDLFNILITLEHVGHTVYNDLAERSDDKKIKIILDGREIESPFIPESNDPKNIAKIIDKDFLLFLLDNRIEDIEMSIELNN